MVNRKNKIMAAVTAALAAGAISGGVAVANAAPTALPTSPPAVVDTQEAGDMPDPQGAVDTPEPGDTPDTGAVDRDHGLRRDQNGPEVAGTAGAPAAPTG